MATEAASLLVNVRALGITKVKGELLALQGGLVAAEGSAVGAGTAVEGAGKSASKSGGLFGRSTRQLIGYAAGFASIAAAAKLVRSSITTTEELAKSTASLTSLTGISTKQGSAWIEVAKQRGVESTKLSRGFVTLQKAMVGATDEQAKHNKELAEGRKAGLKPEQIDKLSSSIGKQSKVFRDLGISQKELRAGNTTKVLLDVADAFHKMGPGADRSVAATKLLGKAGVSLVGFLSQGSAAIQKQLGLADQYGATLDGKTLKATLRAIQAQREFNLAMDGLKITLGTLLIPQIDKGVVAFNKFMLQARSGTGAGGEFVSTMKDLGAAVIPRVQEFAHMTAEITKFIAQHKALAQIATAIGIIGVAAKAISFVVPIGAVKEAIKVYKELRAVATGAAVAETAAAAGGVGGGPKAAGVAGTAAGVAWAGAFSFAVGAALVPLSAKVARMFAEWVHPGSTKEHDIKEILPVAPGSRAEADKQVREARGKIPSHPQATGLNQTTEADIKRLHRQGQELTANGVAAQKVGGQYLVLGEVIKKLPKSVSTKILLGGDQETRTKIRTLVSQIHGVPAKTVARILTDAPTAKVQVAALSAIVKGVPAKKVLHIIHNAKSSKDAYHDLEVAVRKVPAEKKLHIESNVPTVLDSVRDLESSLKSLSNIDVTLPPVTGGKQKRRGGRMFAAGGLVPAMMSPGEALRFPGGGWGMVPGTPTAADSVAMSVPVGTEVFTGSGQAMLAAGASRSAALSMQAPHFGSGGTARASSVAGASHQVGATWYGDGHGHDDPYTVGAAGKYGDLSKIKWAYAELGMGSSLGGLSKGHKLMISRGHKGVVAGKYDIGPGYGDRKIDLWNDVANELNFFSVGKGPVWIANTPKSWQLGPMSYLGIEGGHPTFAPKGSRAATRAGGDPDGPTRSVLAGKTTKVSGPYRPNLGDESDAPGGFFDFRGNPTGLLAETLGNVQMPTFKTIGTKKAPSTSSGGGGGSAGANVAAVAGRYHPSMLKGLASWAGATWKSGKVSAWIKPLLLYARNKGWGGSVSSGYRSYAEQKRIYDSGVRPAAVPGTSRHEGINYPLGAIDVSSAGQLAGILNSSPFHGVLQYAGGKDPVHFSHPSGGGYRAGGTVKDSLPGLGFMRKVWGAARGMYPAGARFVAPQITHGRDSLFVGVDQTPGVGAGHRGFYWPDWLKLQPDEQINLLLHEWAHEYQRTPLPEWQAEGGAEAFARLFGGRVAAGAGVKWANPKQSSYSGFVSRVMSKLGRSWVTSGQFTALAHFKKGGKAKVADPKRKTKDVPRAKTWDASQIFATIDSIGTAGNTSIAKVKGSLTTLAHQLQNPAVSFTTLKSASARARGAIGKLRADHKLTPREKVQLPRLEKAMGLIEGEIRNRILAPGVTATDQIDAFDDTDFQDYLVTQGIDPESEAGKRQRTTRGQMALSSLQGMVPGLEEAYARAQASGNPALIKSTGDTLGAVRRAITHETADLVRLNAPSPDSGADDVAQQQLDATKALNDLIAQQIANQNRLTALIQTQGPQLLAGVIAAVNGGIGGRIGLGSQTPGFAGAGGLARY